jgi:hypothetical protein
MLFKNQCVLKGQGWHFWLPSPGLRGLFERDIHLLSGGMATRFPSNRSAIVKICKRGCLPHSDRDDTEQHARKIQKEPGHGWT